MAPFDAALLSSFLIILTPVLIAATGELVSETSGVLNIGLEGFVLAGAFSAFVVALETGSVAAGFAGGVGGALLCGIVMASLSVNARADQIVVGIGVNLLVIGLTSFLYAEFFSDTATRPIETTLGELRIPLLADLGAVGEALFAQDIVVYLAPVLLAVTAYALNRTTWGIGMRAVGENPGAADAAGLSVKAMRWAGTLIAAGMAGIAGAYLSIGDLGVFRDEMTAGRGFLALTAVLFGRWRPLGVLGACVIFAFADALQLRLQGADHVPDAVWWLAAAIIVALALYLMRGFDLPRSRLALLGAMAVTGAGFVLLAATGAAVSIPTSLWLASPFVLALIALAAAGEGRARMPAKLAIPFTRGQD